MKIELNKITIKDIFEGYKDSQENGVVAYGGRLDVRPKYQREFVYKDKQRDAVIDTVIKGFPLNVMYWVKKDDGDFEVLDGQQRTLSICQYLNHDFSIKDKDGVVRYIDNWEADTLDKIMNYECMIYICEGSDTEKLEWFKTINIAGEKLSDQELRNAVYAGAWLTNAKRYFSRIGCPGIKTADKYLSCDIIRQGLLERALTWIALSQNITIEEYMAKHQHDLDAGELWSYFQEVVLWVGATFTKPRSCMKSVDWGTLYHKYGQGHYDVDKLEFEVATLIADDDVTKPAGVYEYVFDHNEKHLQIRTFDKRDKQHAFEKQKGKCPVCGKTYKIEEMEADHIVPWSKGGKTVRENCQCLCKECNRKKSNSTASGEDSTIVLNGTVHLHSKDAKIDKYINNIENYHTK